MWEMDGGYLIDVACGPVDRSGGHKYFPRPILFDLCYLIYELKSSK